MLAMGPALMAGDLAELDLEQSLELSKTTGKPLYVVFSGSDWSLSSKRFQERVLDTEAFKAFAGENLVYFPVEARRKPPLTKEETAKLQAWVIHFDIKTYPTVILLAPGGQEIIRHAYKDVEADAYIDLLKAILPPGD
jgi:protein disulfide-isomerase